LARANLLKEAHFRRPDIPDALEQFVDVIASKAGMSRN
jgi:hypothetical protein